MKSQSLHPVPPSVLAVRDLVVEFRTDRGPIRAVRGVSLDVRQGQTLGVVGESGSGKTALALAIVNLLPQPVGRIVSGDVVLAGRVLTRMSEDELDSLRGRDVGFIFQDPMVSLNPVMQVGRQIAEAIVVHNAKVSRSEVRNQVIELFGRVGLPDPAAAYERFPHEMSGGMRQRAMVAMAIANEPSVLIADEPTTALDVTVQAQVMEALRDIQAASGTAMILISHDLGLVSEIADRIIVMYAGRVVEEGPTMDVLRSPKHPYTVGLLRSSPSFQGRGSDLPVIPGNPPNPREVGTDCPFRARCDLSRQRVECCVRPELQVVDSVGHSSACHFAAELVPSSPGYGRGV